MKVYIYLSLLFLMIVFIYSGLRENSSSPLKIRILSIGVFITLFIRVIVLDLLFVVNNIQYLYLTEPFCLINLVSIPIAALISIYIFIRNDNINFSYIFIILSLVIILYFYIVLKSSSKLMLNLNYGYVINFDNPLYVYLPYIIFNVIFILIALKYYGSNVDNFGLGLVVVSSFLFIMEIISNIACIKFFPHLIVGDVSWILTLNYGLSRIKKSKN